MLPLKRRSLNFYKSNRTPAAAFATIGLSLVLAGCSGLPVYAPRNPAALGSEGVQPVEPDPGKVIVWLALSGGGTRAAALAYGAMERLQEIAVKPDGKQQGASNLLREVDYISSVSGGSFAAAFYALNRDVPGWGKRFQDDFLNRNIELALLSRVALPHNLLRIALTNDSRTDVAADYYDTHLFDEKRFKDLPQKPQLILNSSDLVVGRRFEFTQEDFNCLASAIGDYRVADAVTASSAFPGGFPSMILGNYGPHNECVPPPAERRSISACLTTQEQIAAPFLLTADRQNLRNDMFSIAEKKRQYCDLEIRPRIHLSDGGLTDNLGLDALLYRVKSRGSAVWSSIAHKTADALVIITVNAATAPEEYLGRSSGSAWFGKVLLRGTDIFLEKAAADTLRRVRDEIAIEVQRVAQVAGGDLKVYFLDITFDDIQDRDLKHRLQNLPTSFKLPPDSVSELIQTGRELLEKGRDGDNGRDLEKICNLFGPVKILKTGETCLDAKQ